MTTFALFKRPTRLVFLDDDIFFLQVLQIALPQDWRADLFLNPHACLAHIQKNGNALIQDFYQQQALLEKAKSPNSKYGLIFSILKYWHNTPDRFNLVQLATFDFGMPGINGLDAFEKLGNWPGRRVLLTGQADDTLAVEAFNRAAIHKFIAKQGGDLRQSLLFQLPSLLEQPLPQTQAFWNQSLSFHQQQWLSEPTVVAALNRLVLENNWIEYAVTHAPFGLLAADPHGVVFWLQFTPETDLIELANQALASGEEKRVIDKITNGKLLLNTLLRASLGDAIQPDSSPVLQLGLNQQQAEHLGQSPCQLLGAIWTLGAPFNLPVKATYSAWQAANPTVTVE
jgi:CheY-like chemotaxis protein